jgi:hypothetical protein
MSLDEANWQREQEPTGQPAGMLPPAGTNGLVGADFLVPFREETRPFIRGAILLKVVLNQFD